jgi:tetratricopeptide (TPR) repeat protein
MPGPRPLPPEVQAKLSAAQDRMAQQPRSFDAARAVADVLFDAGRLVEAVAAYQQAADRARDTLALLDELAAKKPDRPGDPSALSCAPASAERVEVNDLRARQLREAGDAAGAWTCARQAAAPVLEALVRRANALFLVGNVDPALAEFEKVLLRDPDLPEALFYTGGLLLNRRAATAADLARAQKAWTRFLEVAPKDHPRRAEVEKTLPELAEALARPAADPHAGHDHGSAGTGDAPMPAGHPAVPGSPHPGAAEVADADQAMEEAEGALAQGDGPTAARLYMGIMNVRPDDPRMQAGLAASQFLKGSAMAERVFSVAATNDPKAVDELAARLGKRGNPGLARTLLQRLAAANPDYARKADLKARMK